VRHDHRITALPQWTFSPVPAEIVAVANHKGGVGKSFTAVSLASGMAHAGWRTLLVDCDAQANATSMFDPGDEVEFDLLDVIVGGVEVAKAVITTRIPGSGPSGCVARCRTAGSGADHPSLPRRPGTPRVGTLRPAGSFSEKSPLHAVFAGQQGSTEVLRER
jgi:hypothetical protein